MIARATDIEHLSERDLKTAFLRCDREATFRMLDVGDGALCAATWDALLKRTFDNDLTAALAWWRVHRQQQGTIARGGPPR